MTGISPAIPTTTASHDAFTHAIQKVGYSYQQTDPLGPTDLDGFIRALHTFPWVEQWAAWDEHQDGPLPQLVLQNTTRASELWVSFLGEPGTADNRFASDGCQLHYMSMKPHKGLFGWGKETLRQEVKSASVDTRETALALCGMFYAGQIDALEREMDRWED